MNYLAVDTDLLHFYVRLLLPTFCDGKRLR